MYYCIYLPIWVESACYIGIILFISIVVVIIVIIMYYCAWMYAKVALLMPKTNTVDDH